MVDITKLALEDRENQKFFSDNDGKVAVNVGGSLTSTPSGLNIGGKVTEVTLNDTTWTPLPLTPLTDRNAVAIQNRSGIEVKINYDNTAIGYLGMVIPTGGERFYDLTDDILIYAKASSGTPILNIEELA